MNTKDVDLIITLLLYVAVATTVTMMFVAWICRAILKGWRW